MNKFKKIETGISGLYIIEPTVFEDERGFFMESYNQQDFRQLGLDYDFIQDNHSKSVKGVLRGLHFQKHFPQAKLVRVIRGEVYDVAIDLRLGSNTYGQHYGIRLSAENKKQFLIPRGFAHGFLVLSEEAEFVYKCDDWYVPSDGNGILWSDPKLNIAWPLEEIGGARALILSEKDKNWGEFDG